FDVLWTGGGWKVYGDRPPQIYGFVIGVNQVFVERQSFIIVQLANLFMGTFVDLVIVDVLECISGVECFSLCCGDDSPVFELWIFKCELFTQDYPLTSC